VVKAAAPRSTADGSPAKLPVFVARPRSDGSVRRPAILLIQEIFGVNPHIQDVARRYAAAGYVVVAPDLFYRTGEWQEYGYTDMAATRPALAPLTEELVMGDIAAALAYLAEQPDVDPTRIGVVGFCFGGRLSFLSAARFSGQVKAAAVFYGGGIVGGATSDAWPRPPIERAGEIRCPVIAFFGGLDKHISADSVVQMDAALGEAGVNRQVFLYPYADHGFVCDARATYNARAAQDAWHRVQGFFGAHLGPVPDVTWKEHGE
jgi:carboxymethylenebutenolidase